jgi:alkanesulfonate monooxygenase SsuD/methylene tetrahydromethanopterin reductase-like flavin-dependent oxidoreductase (luciferase family)
MGGQSKVAARRAGRIADGFFPGRGLPLDLIALARQSACEAGRDPAALEITVSMPDDPATLPGLAAAGVGRVLVPVTHVAGLKAAATGIDGVLSWKDTIAR